MSEDTRAWDRDPAVRALAYNGHFAAADAAWQKRCRDRGEVGPYRVTRQLTASGLHFVVGVHRYRTQEVAEAACVLLNDGYCQGVKDTREHDAKFGRDLAESVGRLGQ